MSTASNVLRPASICQQCGGSVYNGVVHQCTTAPTPFNWFDRLGPVQRDKEIENAAKIVQLMKPFVTSPSWGKWDIRFLKMARLVGSWSKDPSTQTGAVIVRPDRSVASVGFNGFPRNMKDDPALYADREQKYSRIVHAEINALIHAAGAVNGHTLYIYPLAPCDRCAVQLLQAGITRFVFPTPTEDAKSRWAESLARTASYIKEAGAVQVEVPLANLEEMTPAKETRSDYV